MNSEGNHLRADRVTWNRTPARSGAEGNVRVVNPAATSLMATASCSRTRCATASSRTCCSCSPTAAGSPRPRRERERRLHHPLPRRLHAVRGGRRGRLPAGTRPGRSPRSASSTTRSATASATRARPSTCSARRSSPCPASRIPTAAQGGGSGLLVPEIRLTAATASSSACLIISGSRRNRDATITPHVYTERAADARGPNTAQLTAIGAFQLARLRHLRLAAAARPRRRRGRGRGHPRLCRGQRPVPAQPPLERHRVAAATSPTAPSCAATTSPATTGCARSSRPSGSPPTATSRSPAGPSRACGRPTSQASSRSPCPRSTPAGGCRSRARRPDRAAGEQPRHPPHRGPGHASAPSPARAGTGAASPAGPGADAHRLMPAATSIMQTTTCSPTTAIYRGEAGWQRPRHRSARGRGEMAVRRPVHRRHPAADPAPPARRLAADRESRNPQRGCARGRSRGFATCSRSTASPATTAGRTAPRVTYGLDWGLDLPGRRGPDHDRPELPARPQAQHPARTAPACPTASPISSGGPTSGSAGCRTSSTASASTRTTSRSAATRSTPWSAAARPMRRSAISGSTATSTRRSRTCATARRCGSAAGSASPRYWSVFGSTVIDLTDRDEDPLSLADGFEPIRHRIGISYDDDCLEIGVTWRRDYETPATRAAATPSDPVRAEGPRPLRMRSAARP